MSEIVVIGASAGGFAPLLQIVAALPATCSASVFVVMHIGARPSLLPLLLARAGSLPSEFATDLELVEPGRIYVAPPEHHMLLRPSYIRLSQSPKVNFTRPAINPLFVSAAEAYGKAVLGIVLSGLGSDGAAGLRAIKDNGGKCLVQDPEDAAQPSMPLAALAAVPYVAYMPIQVLVRSVVAFCAR